MAKVGAQRASELTGVSKSTIQRCMNNGKLSFELDSSNRRVVDVSELDRVFGLRKDSVTSPASRESDGGVEAELRKATDMLEMERLKMRIKMLESQIETAQEQITDLREQRDQWQRQAQQVLLTSQYSQKQAEGLQEELRERERRENERRKLVMESRMKKMHGLNQNQNDSHTASESPESQAPSSGSVLSSDTPAKSSVRLGMVDLWRKIRGEAA